MDHHGTIETKNKAQLALKKASGTLAKVQKLVDDDAYCPDIIQQIDAVMGLLKSSKKQLLKGHLDHCLVENLQKDKAATLHELISIFNLNQ